MDNSTDMGPGGQPGGHIVAVEGLLGRLLGKPDQNQPVGEDVEQPMKVTALQSDGINIQFTIYRPADISGHRPVWFEFAKNEGDVDTVPVGMPMGPRHFQVPGSKPNKDPLWPYEHRQFGEE